MSWVFLILFFAFILLIIEMARLALESTGLAREVARFQAISLLTGTGFTTSEAELVIRHPVRRKVAEVLIIFGHIAFAIIIAIFFNLLSQEITYSHLFYGLFFLASIFLIFRIHWFQNLLIKKMKVSINKHATIEDIYHLSEKDIVIQIKLDAKHKGLFKSLGQLNLANQYDIHILTIERLIQNTQGSESKFIKHPTGSTCLQRGDNLLVYGKKEMIGKIFGKEN
jgi:hypothetical protein